MRGLWRNHSLSIVTAALFFACWTGQSLAGVRHHNEEQARHGAPPIAWSAYIVSGEFLESTFENWESEFLQMAAFVWLSSILVQRGAAESKRPDEQPEDVQKEKRPDSPRPVLRGGLALAVYQRSLPITLFALFLFSFAMHAVGGARQQTQEALQHGVQAVSVLAYVGTASFWFESFHQNWQSEFLAVLSLVILSIWLRQKESPESKKVTAPHRETGRA